jgi:hypothetical protein
MKTFFTMNSPDLDQALGILKESHNFEQNNSSFEAKISLLCGGTDHTMTFPVYGKNCIHIEVCLMNSKLILANRFGLFCTTNFSRTGIRMDMSFLCNAM